MGVMYGCKPTLFGRPHQCLSWLKYETSSLKRGPCDPAPPLRFTRPGSLAPFFIYFLAPAVSDLFVVGLETLLKLCFHKKSMVSAVANLSSLVNTVRVWDSSSRPTRLAACCCCCCTSIQGAHMREAAVRGLGLPSLLHYGVLWHGSTVQAGPAANSSEAATAAQQRMC